MLSVYCVKIEGIGFGIIAMTIVKPAPAIGLIEYLRLLAIGPHCSFE